ncbi:MAG: diaminopimelate epimerase [uncultured bacterium]|nr:MAG: diaminopimelate epimerase [uncultured bacterium]OFW68508.1 MAG: diaminopimelate epimerase [Alphaproteobacteria bacterium GWC2_42_16]OFW73199.1 MAG: diaminopimelate epimerase [Alphaproteobacteria bacterium GWA2_41_27]OFW81570.1 MAG: diaminopimelate epimerase [Alphaproteobacteria bacterium RIFCSPHIGHO2_12_FULL_42_100]OFW85344.1 MAG: diaminopimelate epimerase [Alphaproteobacteria bacterium RBG_16_42_14]OFW90438.1 MAG: diaminopimelate epimerase [Alphaproteobacteria bacterium RIFCSPHIGHO2_0
MATPFTKMQALGNDFVLIEENALKKPLTTKQIRFLADRRRGIGCDQLIIFKDSPKADATLAFYNADGSTAQACGNGIRCVAHYLGKDRGTIQTPSFLSTFWKKKNQITVSLRDPTFQGPLHKGHRVNVGNPHLVFFTEDLEEYDLEGLALSFQPARGINVELAQIISPKIIKAKVWERGAGITPACGSGACAVGILGLKLGLIKESPVSIEMPGGSLTVEWAEGKPLFLTGPVEFCYEGIIDIL